MASPALMAAIEKIGGEDKLADLPDELNDDGWQVILDGFRLEPLQFTALKKHRMAMVRQQQHEEQPQHPKKIKTSFSLDRPEDALESVKAWANANQPKNALDPRDTCYPFKLKKTWKRDVTNESLRQMRTTILKTLTTDDDRGPLAIAVRHGLGNGKAHFLREAPSMLGQEKQSVYLTYNGDQNLAADAKEPGKCVLLRILFALFGTGHVGSSTFLLSSEANEWTRFDTSALVTLTVQCLEASLPEEATGFCVCVDELRKLEGLQGSLPDLLSTLGWLVKVLHSSRRRLFCTVLVTALTTSVIKTVAQSDRMLE